MAFAKSIESFTKEAVFALFSVILRKRRSDTVPFNGAKIRKILLLRPDKLGDMITTLPLIDALRTSFPQVKIFLLCSERNYPLVTSDPRFERIHIYRKNFFRDLRTIMKLRREGFDTIIDPVRNDSATTLFISQLSSSKGVRIGLGKSAHARFYDFNQVENPENQEHTIDFTLRLLEPFNIDGSGIDRYAHPYIDNDSCLIAQKILEQIEDSNGGKFLIGYNVSGGRPARRLSQEKSSSLLNSIISQNRNIQVLLFSAPSDYELCRELKEGFQEHVRLLPRGLNIIEVSALISRLNLMLSPDTSLIHIARSYRVPVIGFYTGSRRNFLHWHPYGQREGVVFSNNEYDIHDISVPDIVALFNRVRKTAISGQQR